MQVVAVYSFNDGEEIIKRDYLKEFNEVISVISSIDAEAHKIKESKEKTKLGQLLYSPTSLNESIKEALNKLDWYKKKHTFDYDGDYYIKEEYKNLTKKHPRPYREMDYVKNNVGIEVQFGKYAFMLYDICGKMIIFNKLGFIKVGIEIVPVKNFSMDMSTGVSYFEQISWDLENRGVSNLDIPVLVLGIDA